MSNAVRMALAGSVIAALATNSQARDWPNTDDADTGKTENMRRGMLGAC
jgi:hypothetical protein